MTRVPFSSRSGWETTPNRLAQRRDELARAAVEILDLTESNPTRCGFDYSRAEVSAALRSRAGQANEPPVYAPEPRGLREAREAVSRYYGARGLAVDPSRIILCASTSEAYAWIMKILCDPGDEVLAPAPSYPLLDFLAQAEGVTLRRYPLEYDGRWWPDLEELARRIAPRTRCVVAVQPNNPTGSFFTTEELAGLGTICAARGIALVSDEVFFDYPFDAGRMPSALDLEGPLTFVLGGLSKAVGMPHLKLSWIVVGGSGRAGEANEALARLEVLGDTFLPVSTPVQLAASDLVTAGWRIQEQILERVRANRAWLAGLQDHDAAWECLAAEGGWSAVLRLPRVMDDESWSLTFLERDHVLVHPGYFFDFAGEGYIVVSLLPPEDFFREGMSRIQQRVRSQS